MPLNKSSSNKARNENILREIAAGKPPREAVGEAYGIQREAKKKKRKRAEKKR